MQTGHKKIWVVFRSTYINKSLSAPHRTQLIRGISGPACSLYLILNVEHEHIYNSPLQTLRRLPASIAIMTHKKSLINVFKRKAIDEASCFYSGYPQGIPQMRSRFIELCVGMRGKKSSLSNTEAMRMHSK